MGEVKVLQKDFALDQIGRLFPLEWKLLTPDEIVITRLSVGHCNCVYIVENIKPNQSKEPTKLIVRIYGGNFCSDKPELIPQTVEGESLIFYEASRQRIGPRLYGLFKGGRVEEYIDMRHMTQADVSNLEITREMARTLVKYHNLDLPLPRPGYDFVDVHMKLFRLFKASGQKELRKNKDFSKFYDPSEYCDYDYFKAIQWLGKLNDRSRSRMVLMHWDNHNMNIILTKDPAAYGGQRLFLCDFELSAYNTRGKDLGIYLLSQMMCMDNLKNDNSVNPFPLNEESTKVFLTEYQKALGESGHLTDFDPNGKDSYDQLLLETMAGAMTSFFCFLLYFIAKTNIFIEMDAQRFSNYIHVTFMGFKETKRALEVTFPKFSMDAMM